MDGQIEQLNFLGVLQRPSFNGLAVMIPQVVQYQEHFALCIFDQRPTALHLSTDLSVSILRKPRLHAHCKLMDTKPDYRPTITR